MDQLTDDNGSTNIFELVYNKDKKGLRNTVRYSYSTILGYPEVPRLIFIATLIQSSGYMYLITQDISIGDKYLDVAMVSFYLGSLIGLLVTISYSHFLFRQHMIFLPVSFTSSLMLIFNLGIFIYSLTQDDPP